MLVFVFLIFLVTYQIQEYFFFENPQKMDIGCNNPCFVIL